MAEVKIIRSKTDIEHSSNAILKRLSQAARSGLRMLSRSFENLRMAACPPPQMRFFSWHRPTQAATLMYIDIRFFLQRFSSTTADDGSQSTSACLQGCNVFAWYDQLTSGI
jgi:hypothetical protein